MSVKVFNDITGKWEKKSSVIANSIQVVDLEGKYQSNNVNGVLSEISDKITKIQDDVKYIYENGTLDGGNGNGVATPVITIQSVTVNGSPIGTDVNGEMQYLVNSDDSIIIN